MLLNEITTPEWPSGLNIVYDLGEAVITVDDLSDATYAAVYVKKHGRIVKVGQLTTRGRYSFGRETYLAIGSASVDAPYRKSGYGGYLYKALLTHTSLAGLASYLPDQVNKRAVPAIYQRLRARVIGDFGVIPKP